MKDVKTFIKQKFPLITDADLAGEGRTTMYIPDVVKLMEDFQRLLQQADVIKSLPCRKCDCKYPFQHRRCDCSCHD